MISGTFNFMIVFQAEHKKLCSLNRVNCWKALLGALKVFAIALAIAKTITF
jgi:hypothetical protein